MFDGKLPSIWSVLYLGEHIKGGGALWRICCTLCEHRWPYHGKPVQFVISLFLRYTETVFSPGSFQGLSHVQLVTFEYCFLGMCIATLVSRFCVCCYNHHGARTDF